MNIVEFTELGNRTFSASMEADNNAIRAKRLRRKFKEACREYPELRKAYYNCGTQPK